MTNTDGALGSSASVDDLGAVASRFASWKSKHETRSKVHGLRELTYEEAVRTSRFQRKSLLTDQNFVAGIPAASTKIEALGESAKSEDVAPVPASDSAGCEPKTSALRTCSALQPSALQSSALQQRRVPAAEVRALLRSAVASLAQTKPALATRIHFNEATPTTFAQALLQAAGQTTGAVKIALKSAASMQAQPGDGALSTMTLTLSEADQTLIQARAAEAKLTVSAYVRQCALEVEQLRKLVDQALSALPQNARTWPGPASLKVDTPKLQLSEETSWASTTAPPPDLPRPPAPSMLARLGSLFTRRGSTISVTA